MAPRTLPDGRTPLDGDPVATLKLTTPIPFGGQDVDELRFMRRITADDLIWVEENDYEGTRANVMTTYRLTGVSEGSLRRLDGHDARKLEGLLAGFLISGPRTGEPDLPFSSQDSAGRPARSTS